MLNWWARSRPSKSFLKNPFFLKNPVTLTLSTMWPPTFTRFIFLVFVFEWSSFCFSLFLFLCLCVGFSCLCFCVGVIWVPACWRIILDRLCFLVVFEFWPLLEVGIVFFLCVPWIYIHYLMHVILDNGFLSSGQSSTFSISFTAWFRLSLSTSTFNMSSNKSPLSKKNKWLEQAQLCGRQQSDQVWRQCSGRLN